MTTTDYNTNNHYGGVIDYSNSYCRWGEGPYAGNWAGAAENGGINFGLLSNSCGARFNLWPQEITPLFGGMTVLGMIMPITPQSADDVDAPSRGTALANAYKTNPSGSIGEAWVESIVGIPYNDGTDCPYEGSSYAYGGGFGIQGCGAQLTYSVDSSSGYAIWDRDSETWSKATSDIYDSTGNSYWAAKWECNYDCNTYHPTL